MNLKKISIGSKFVDGPWGGGNSFAIQLKNYLLNKGFEVVNNLEDIDIDLILLTEPRRHTQISSFTHIEIDNYLRDVNPNTIVVNRINECDERKDTRGLNNFLMNTSLVADHTVFISEWLSELFLQQGFTKERYSIIRNGADENIFKSKQKAKNQKIKIVTHHWGDNKNKGKSIYEKLDELLENKEFSEKFEFSYIGKLPKNTNFRNTIIVEPKHGALLGEELNRHDLYITGSINEPAGMHHIEGAMCGLPVLYIESGGITEYCKGYGLAYNENNLVEKLFEISRNYDFYKNKSKNYPHIGKVMCESYLELFNNLYSNRKSVKYDRDKNNYKLKKQHKIFKSYIYI
jgi:hypothetical protein